MAVVQEAPFIEGTIELDVRGEDVQQQSFPGVAFGVQNDSTYEAVYTRPFNFRVADTVRQKRAVQYIASPAWDWPRLRAESPGKFEDRVLPVPDPTAWVPLRLVVTRTQVTVFANGGSEPDLVVQRLGDVKPGPVALWVGNNSRGDFANVRVTPANAVESASVARTRSASWRAREPHGPSQLQCDARRTTISRTWDLDMRTFSQDS